MQVSASAITLVDIMAAKITALGKVVILDLVLERTNVVNN